MIEKGVIILALGHANYGRMALNLAVSLKSVNGMNGVHVTLLHSAGIETLYNHNELQFFDGFIEVPENYYKFQGDKEYQMAKCYMYDLSPYQKTIYLDADSLWLPERKIDSLFDECYNQPVSFQCIDKWDIQGEWGCLWTAGKEKNDGLKQIRELYDITDNRTIYEMQSSFMYFEKSRVAKAFYDTAKECYIKRPFWFYTWNGGIPDELVFNISSAINEIKLPKFPYTPLWFIDYENRFKNDNSRSISLRNRGTIWSKYYAFSMAGNTNPQRAVEIYDDLVKGYYSRFPAKIRFPWLWKQKRQYLTTRLAA
jgi:hypothetical protein